MKNKDKEYKKNDSMDEMEMACFVNKKQKKNLLDYKSKR